MEAIQGGREARVGRAKPPEEGGAHQEISHPPDRRLPDLMIVPGPEGKPFLEVVHALLGDHQTPESLDDYRGSVPPPRMNPGRQNGDRVFAGRAQVPPRLEHQENAAAESEDLAFVASVALNTESALIITSQLSTTRMGTKLWTARLHIANYDGRRR